MTAARLLRHAASLAGAAFFLSGAAAAVTDLGPRVFGATTHAAAFGPDRTGADKAYILQDGALDGGATPGRLAVIDVNTGAVERTFILPATEGGWGLAVADDGSVYAGAYRSGHVFRYAPGDTGVTDLGEALPGQTFLYGLCAGRAGTVYGGTFPGAQVFKYSPADGFSRIGAEPAYRAPDYAPSYVRTVAYDPQREAVYAGLGPGARLARIDLATGETRQILPPQFAGADFVYGARTAGSKVLVRLLSTDQGVALNVASDGGATLDAVFPMTGLSFSPADAGQNVYFTHNRVLTAYNLETKSTRPIGSAPWPANSYATAVVRLVDQTNFPGLSAVGVCNFGGRLWLGKTCLANGHTTTAALEVEPVPQTVSSILAGPDGKIYAGGYLTGGTGVFDPADPMKKSATLRGVEQSEGMTHVGGKIYFGGYPGAYLYEYDPGQPWREGANPRILFTLAAQRQDRPFALAGDGAHRVFMGTVPDYGALGGALTVYDAATGRHATRLAAELGIPDLSIVACVALDGVVYAGTSISGGLGAHPTQTQAKLLRYDAATGATQAIALPASIPNQKAITAVAVGPDRKVWLMAEGWLLVYDPATAGFIHQANLFPDIRYDPSASASMVRDATLLTARDGWVYGTIRGRVLFKLDPVSRAMTVLTPTEGGTDLVEDAAGNLYFTRGTSLFRYARD